MELVGRPIPSGVQGRSWMGLIRGETDRIHDQLFPELTYHAAYDPMRGVRTDRHKYIRSFEQRPFYFPPNIDNGLTKTLLAERGELATPRPQEMLFDLDADPNEQANVVEDPAYAEVLRDLRARLDRWMQETGDPLFAGPVPPPPGAIVTPPDSYDP
jgi:N-sulfoglucosamine sulfohydrolase